MELAGVEMQMAADWHAVTRWESVGEKKWPPIWQQGGWGLTMDGGEWPTHNSTQPELKKTGFLYIELIY